MRFCVAINFSSRLALSIPQQSHTILWWKERSKMRCSELRTRNILETTERERATSTMVNEWQQLGMMEVGNQNSKSTHFQYKWRDVRWHWYQFHMPDPSQDNVTKVLHTTTTKNWLLFVWIPKYGATPPLHPFQLCDSSFKSTWRLKSHSTSLNLQIGVVLQI